MKTAWMILAMLALAGCESIGFGVETEGDDGEAEERENEEGSLARAVEREYRPEYGAEFAHDGERLMVVQTFEEGAEVNGVEVYTVLAVDSTEDPLLMVPFEVVSAYRYGEFEYLRAGTYRYAGTDTYTTQENTLNTIRVFAELPE